MPYKAINENLPVQLASGQGPDMARVVDLGGLSRYALDMRPLLKDPAYWEKNFGPFLRMDASCRRHQVDPGLHDPAHRHRPLRQQDAVRAGRHRDARREGDLGRLGQGGEGSRRQGRRRRSRSRSTARVTASSRSRSRKARKLFDDKGEPDVVDDGFKRAAQLVYDWHKSGVMSKELWGSVSGTAYRGANDEFKNAQVVMYLSGSWQIGQFDKTIGNAFDWVAVPNPCGPGGCTGMPGGAGLVAIKTTQASQGSRAGDGISRQRTGAGGILFSARCSCPAISAWRRRASTIQPRAPRRQGRAEGLHGERRPASPRSPTGLQGYGNNRIIFNAVISRLGQAISGETTLDEAYKRIDADIAQQIAERKKK